MWRPGLAFSLICLCLSHAAGGRQEQQDGPEPPKISSVARASPELREYFRTMHARPFRDVLDEGAINQMLDNQIDEFVRQLVTKNRRLRAAAEKLAAKPDPEKRRYYVHLIREAASDLEGTLRVWSDMLRPANRSHEAHETVSEPTEERLLDQVALYEQQIDRFLFPEEVAVSIEELRAEGFHGTLKTIQHLAQVLEKRK